MVRILGFYVLGIFIGGFLVIQTTQWYLWTAMACLTISFLLTQKVKPSSLCGFFGLTFITLTGWLSTELSDETTQINHLTKLNKRVDASISIVSEPPAKTTTGYRLPVRIIKVRTPEGWTAAESKAYLYFKTEVKLNRGDILLAKGQPQKLKKAPPQSTFDYTLYLKRKNIFFRQYLSPDEIMIAGKSTPDLYAHAIAIRLWCIRQISKFIKGKNEQAIAIALITGQSDGLDPELNQHYAVNGTLHVLSVSGLHTGLLYGILLFLLKPLVKVKHGNWIISLITMTVLWCYSLVTGLSPSVLRAVTMFSFAAISKPLGLRSGIWNTLASSAFILLLFDPWLITGIGFQLSYLALGGIIWLHPLLLRQWEPNSRIMFGAWNITCMSIAAQLTTLPVSLLNFHQFPVWFIPANLLIIPISSVALMAGLAFIPLSTMPGIAECTGMILEFIINIMNHTTIFIAMLPWSSINNIYLLNTQAMLLMCLIISTGIYLEKRRPVFLIFAVSTAAILGVTDHAWKEKEISAGKIILNVKRSGSNSEIQVGGHLLRIEMSSNQHPVSFAPGTGHPWLQSHKVISLNNANVSVHLKDLADVTVINSTGSQPEILKNTLLILGPSGQIQEINADIPEVIFMMNPKSKSSGLNGKLPPQKVAILRPDTVIILDIAKKEIPVD
ncbi:MAG: ComEC/Rec2 family competence protein [Cyclobacteriaceae bacterium]